MNRQTNKEFNQECLPACTWKKILLIALESPELCSTLAAIKELINRRHKELITIKTLKRGEEQRSSFCVAAMVGSLSTAQLQKRTPMVLPWWSSTREQSFAVESPKGIFCGSFSLSFNGGIFRGVLCFRNHTQNDLEFSLKLKLWDPCNWPPLSFL